MLIVLLAIFIALSFAQTSTKCDPVTGNFTISHFQLYPENTIYDANACQLYTANLFNASLGVFNMNTRTMTYIIEFRNVTNNPDFHLAGVQLNPRTNLISLVSGGGIAFVTDGKNITATDLYMQYDPSTQALTRKENLTVVTEGKLGGFQDVEHDPRNNAYVIGTFPSSIVKVSANASGAELWYPEKSPGNTNPGFAGVAAKDWTLIVNDRSTGGLVTFDMRAAKGTPNTVKITPNYTMSMADGMQLPPKYNGTVLLVSENAIGASVFRDKSGEWKEAEFMGVVPFIQNPANSTKALQIGESMFLNMEVFTDEGFLGPGLAGNRSEFLYVDVTQKVDELLSK
ncbi:hypothetical protein CC80DRAFT_404825 [Byssothecium circinans]|uniref:Uncharacterized protein n=1 Tax=Byssothecium circinans TaxID=147558 RepID=A0A6A5UC23_9PLEO|nr:hypothetical protein CC80DRAFT_404825 [Byssothecium circinans]